MLFLFLFSISSVFGEAYLVETCIKQKTLMSCILDCDGELVLFAHCVIECFSMKTCVFNKDMSSQCDGGLCCCSYFIFCNKWTLFNSMEKRIFNTIEIYEVMDDTTLRKLQLETRVTTNRTVLLKI
jgi:hypothetical protein